MAESVEIRALNDGDPETISAAFKGIGAGKPVGQHRRYLAEQLAGGLRFLARQRAELAPMAIRRAHSFHRCS